MRYRCMCFGWYQELLSEVCADDLVAAESRLLHMLDHGGMIVHVYHETDPENPELVGRHCRLHSFIAPRRDANPQTTTSAHEIERFLLDPAHFEAWRHARQTDSLLEQRWSVVELWPIELRPDEDRGTIRIYGKAVRTPPVPANPSALPNLSLSSLHSDVERTGNQP